jgi:hypothetical protein
VENFEAGTAVALAVADADLAACVANVEGAAENLAVYSAAETLAVADAVANSKACSPNANYSAEAVVNSIEVANLAAPMALISAKPLAMNTAPPAFKAASRERLIQLWLHPPRS